MKIDIEKIEIKLRILDQKKVKAIVNLDFGDFVVRGFRIMESQFENMNNDRLWLIPPSYYSGNRYHPVFFIIEKNLWKELEARIWDEYGKKRDEYYKKQYGITDEDLIA